jgi:hypothetical protein
MKLFFTAFLQVFFISIQVICLTRKLYLGVFLVSFTISFIWSFNVSKIAFSNLKGRLIYSSGASIGALTGLLISELL